MNAFKLRLPGLEEVGVRFWIEVVRFMLHRVAEWAQFRNETPKVNLHQLCVWKFKLSKSLVTFGAVFNSKI